MCHKVHVNTYCLYRQPNHLIVIIRLRLNVKIQGLKGRVMKEVLTAAAVVVVVELVIGNTVCPDSQLCQHSLNTQKTMPCSTCTTSS